MASWIPKLIVLIGAIVLPLAAQTALLSYRASQQIFYIPDWFLGITVVVGFGCLAWSFNRRILLAVLYFPSMLYLSIRWLSWFLSRAYGIS